MRRGERSAEFPDRGQGIEPAEQHGRESFRLRHYLYRDFLERGKCPKRAGHQLANIVAGDVFDDFAACLGNFTPPADAAKPEEVITCGACFDPAGPGEIRPTAGNAALRPDQNAKRSGSSRLGRIVVALWWRAIASTLPIR